MLVLYRYSLFFLKISRKFWKNTQKCKNFKSDIRSRIFCLACRWKWMRIAAVYLVPIFILKDHKMQRPRLSSPAKNLVIFTDKSHLIANSVVGSLCMYYKYNINQGPRAYYHTLTVAVASVAYLIKKIGGRHYGLRLILCTL